MINKHWDTWCQLPSSERDKIIGDELFDKPVTSPKFSGHIQIESNTNNLIARLIDMGCSKPIIEELPRSKKAFITIDNNRIGPCPPHKAIAFIGYVVAIERKESDDYTR